MLGNSFQAKGLQKSSSRFRGLEGLDFKVKKNNGFAPLNPNGAHKKTIVKTPKLESSRKGGAI